VPGLSLPYGDDAVELSSCYVMPVMLDDAALREPLRSLMLERHGVQTSVLYPALHEFTAYRDEAPGSIPRSERAARTQLTLPLYPHLDEAAQDRVVEAVRTGLAELQA
jgi:dTDP-4-amino-4,6-dideoxygalactose transaminase